jgi:bifunctional DNase/RNase
MDVDGRHVEVDSRPSDAIALAVRIGVPIYVDEAVLEKGAIEPEEERAAPEGKPEESIREEQLAAFRDVINQLNLDDLGGKPGKQ